MKIDRLSIDEAPIVFDYVTRLFAEIGEEGEELRVLATDQVIGAWRDIEDRFHVFAARSAANELYGILTLVQSFAIYANGPYGIINEMYVPPEHRSRGVGSRLLDAAKDFGRAKGWSRIDVTTPEAERWARTRRFYEKEGFVFTGPKLKFLL